MNGSMIFENIQITGISAAVPKTVVNNLRDHTFVPVEEREKTVKLTGIEEYRRAADGQTAADLCEAAARALLKGLNIDPKTIDGLIFVTMTPDYIAPSTACVLQAKLGLPLTTVAFDVNLTCSGYVYGLYIACSLIQGGSLKKVLLLAGDTQTKVCHREDKNTAFLLGDAGSATILESVPGASSPIRMRFMTDGSKKDSLIIPAGGFRNPSNDKTRKVEKQPDGGARSQEHLYLNGMEVFNFSITAVVDTLKEFIAQENIQVNEMDYLVLHQANRFMTDKIARKLGFSADKVPYSLSRYGNTSSASIPLTMAHCFPKLGDKKDLHCLLSGFGMGLSWGAVDINFKNTRYLDVIEA